MASEHKAPEEQLQQPVAQSQTTQAFVKRTEQQVGDENEKKIPGEQDNKTVTNSMNGDGDVDGTCCPITQADPQELNGKFVSTVHDFLSWRNPVHSSVCLLLGCLAWILLTFGDYTVITLLCYVSGVYVGVCCIYVNTMHVWSNFTNPNDASHPRSHDTDDEIIISVEDLEQYLETLTNGINKSYKFARDILYCKTNVATIKAIGVIFAVGFVGSLFGGVTLFGLTHVLLFTVPVGYARNQEVVDAHLKQAKQVVTDKGKIWVSAVGQRASLLWTKLQEKVLERGAAKANSGLKKEE